MDITVDVPDTIRDWAKSNGLDLSVVVREAVVREQQRRERTNAPYEAEVHVLDVRDEESGCTMIVRLHGKQLARHGDYWLYATRGGSVLVWDDDDQCLYGFDDDQPAPVAVMDVECFRCYPAFYAQIMEALGVDPVIDIGPPR